MSNENYNVEVKDERHECFCHSKWFRKFLIISLGTFVGVYFALCLFTAIHKPPMMPRPFACPCGCMMKHSHHHHFDRGSRGDFYQDMQDKMVKKIPIRVEVED